MGVRRRYVAAVIAAATLAGWALFYPGAPDLPRRYAPAAGAPADPTTDADVSTLLSQVTVVDQLPKVPGYDRGCGIDKATQTREACVFGPAWNDPLNTTSCDSRNRFLHTQLHDIEVKSETRGCKIISGYIEPDPYTGGRTDLADIDLDHIYPLRRVWDGGAWRWDPRRRQILANDFAELAAVNSRANRAKSDSGLDTWLPNYQPCTYVKRYLTVAVKYRLPITAAERSAAVAACG